LNTSESNTPPPNHPLLLFLPHLPSTAAIIIIIIHVAIFHDRRPINESTIDPPAAAAGMY
jgi:hypothetical protein